MAPRCAVHQNFMVRSQRRNRRWYKLVVCRLPRPDCRSLWLPSYPRRCGVQRRFERLCPPAVDAAEGFLARARIAEIRKRIADSEAWLRKAAEAQPPKYRARVALAEFYLAPQHPNPSAAETQAKDAVKLDPGRSAAYSVLAEVYADRGDWNALDATLAAAARQVPDDPVPYYRAAERLIASGRDQARADRYLRLYAGQEREGNQPAAADARGLAKSVNVN